MQKLIMFLKILPALRETAKKLEKTLTPEQRAIISLGVLKAHTLLNQKEQAELHATLMKHSTEEGEK